MLYFWAIPVRRTRGYAAMLCPACRQVQAVRVRDHMSLTFFLVFPLNWGKWARREGRCTACRARWSLTLKRLSAVVRSRRVSLEALVEDTAPDLIQREADRLDMLELARHADTASLVRSIYLERLVWDLLDLTTVRHLRSRARAISLLLVAAGLLAGILVAIALSDAGFSDGVVVGAVIAVASCFLSVAVWLDGRRPFSALRRVMRSPLGAELVSLRPEREELERCLSPQPQWTGLLKRPRRRQRGLEALMREVERIEREEAGR